MIQKDEILKAATFSISAHNVQPFRLAFPSEDSVDIYVDFQRLLPVGDPMFKDLRQSLGAFVETLHIALSAQGYGIKVIEVKDSPEQSAPMAHLKIEQGAKQDPLFAQLSKRFSYRGKFPQKSEIADKVISGDRFTLEFLTAPDDLKEISNLYDNVN